MALDLFFLPRKLTLDVVRSTDFMATPAMARSRNTLIEALLAAHPGSRVEGDPLQGRIADFSHGEMTLTPGYLSWSLHGVTDEAPIREIVDWFHARDMVCEDPQDAGFGNRDLERGARRTTLSSFDDLIGGHLLGIRLLREWGSGILTEWTLALGGHAQIQFVRFESCRLPDLGRLLGSKVIGTYYETEDSFRTLHVYFENDLELTLQGAIFQKWSVQPKRP